MNTDIYNKKNVCKYLLKSIEDSTDDGSVNKELLDVSGFSIEHIMPQKLTEYWRQELGEDFARIHEKYLHTLGNLTLTSYNSELGNKTFEEKKQYIKDKNSHIVMLNRDVLSQEKWNDEAIRNRNERLSAILLKLFYIDKPLRYVNLNDDSEKRFRWAMTSMLPAVSPKCVFYAVNLYLWIRFRQCCPKLSKLFTIWIAIL